MLARLMLGFSTLMLAYFLYAVVVVELVANEAKAADFSIPTMALVRRRLDGGRVVVEAPKSSNVSGV